MIQNASLRSCFGENQQRHSASCRNTEVNLPWDFGEMHMHPPCTKIIQTNLPWLVVISDKQAERDKPFHQSSWQTEFDPGLINLFNWFLPISSFLELLCTQRIIPNN